MGLGKCDHIGRDVMKCNGACLLSGYARQRRLIRRAPRGRRPLIGCAIGIAPTTPQTRCL